LGALPSQQRSVRRATALSVLQKRLAYEGNPATIASLDNDGLCPVQVVAISPALWAERMMSARTTHSPLLTQEAGYLVIEAADGAASLKILQ
jgi:hypothetical protein